MRNCCLDAYQQKARGWLRQSLARTMGYEKGLEGVCCVWAAGIFITPWLQFIMQCCRVAVWYLDVVLHQLERPVNSRQSPVASHQKMSPSRNPIQDLCSRVMAQQTATLSFDKVFVFFWFVATRFLWHRGGRSPGLIHCSSPCCSCSSYCCCCSCCSSASSTFWFCTGHFLLPLHVINTKVLVVVGLLVFVIVISLSVNMCESIFARALHELSCD